MLRPPTRRPPSLRANASASEDTASFGGLADVLEPDYLDIEPDDAVTSLRHLGAASVRPSAAPPSAMAPLSAMAPVSERGRAPLVVQDFAFADTVFADELPGDEVPPSSGPIYTQDAAGNTQCVTPLAFPLPSPSPAVHADLATRVRVFFAQVGHAFRRSREEMRELWAGTAEIVGDGQPLQGPGLQASTFRRVLALWSCFQWSRADVTRAAMIGLGVFVFAAAIGATTMDRGTGQSDGLGPAAASTGVRAQRTLDQHTGKKIVLRLKR